MTEKSIKAGEAHANVRAQAERYGNEKQLERILEKIHWLYIEIWSMDDCR